MQIGGWKLLLNYESVCSFTTLSNKTSIRNYWIPVVLISYTTGAHSIVGWSNLWSRKLVHSFPAFHLACVITSTLHSQSANKFKLQTLSTYEDRSFNLDREPVCQSVQQLPDLIYEYSTVSGEICIYCIVIKFKLVMRSWVLLFSHHVKKKDCQNLMQSLSFYFFQYSNHWSTTAVYVLHYPLSDGV